MPDNIILLGYRGTGKSTVASLLAAKLGTRVISIDDAIVKSAGEGIPQIVEKFGWDYFRDLETRELKKACSEKDIVIDAGGGVVTRQANIDEMKKSGRCILLTASVETIASRISGDANRPSLTGKGSVEEIRQVLSERDPLYKAAADIVIATDGRTPESIAEEMLRLRR